MEELSYNEERVTLKDLILKIKYWWVYVSSKWVIIFISAMLGGLIGLINAFGEKPVYTAELTFVLDDDQSAGSNMGGYASIAGQFGIDVGSSGGGAFSGENLLALMKSRSMIELTLLKEVIVKGKRQTLAELYIDMNGLRDEWIEENSEMKDLHFTKDINPLEFSLEQNNLMTSFYTKITKQYLTVGRLDKKSSIVLVQVDSPNELFSKLFIEALVEQVSDFYKTTKTKKSVDNLELLQAQSDSVRRALFSAFSGAASSTDATPNPNLSKRQSIAVPSLRRQVDIQVNQAMIAELVRNLEATKMSLRKETPLIQLIDRPAFPLSETKPSMLLEFIKASVLSAFLVLLYLIVRKILNDLV